MRRLSSFALLSAPLVITVYASACSGPVHDGSSSTRSTPSSASGTGGMGAASTTSTGGAGGTANTTSTGGAGGTASTTSTGGAGGAASTASTGGATSTSTTTTSTTTTSTSTSTSTTSTSTSSGVVDAGPVDSGAVSTVYPAPFPAPPQIVTLGGPVVAKPLWVPIFFAGDDPSIQAPVTDFLSVVGGTSYWAATTSEYGVGPATSAPAIVLAEAAPQNVDDSTIPGWLAAKVSAAEIPAPAAGTVYVIHYPTSTTITITSPGFNGISCLSLGAYHSEGPVGAVEAPYVVMPRCPPPPGMSAIDQMTSFESHELVEVSTDPFFLSDRAYDGYDPAHEFLGVIDTELADVCQSTYDADIQLPGLPYLVQRTWSNQAALAGHDPCTPEFPGEVYFAAAPELPDLYNGDVAVVMTQGQPRTIALDLYSEGATGGPWTVAVSSLSGDVASYSLDASSGQNGQKLWLTIQPTGGSGASVFQVVSTLGAVTTTAEGLVFVQ